MQALASQAVISARVRPKDLHRRLELFGNPFGQVDFEYPNEAVFAQMPSDLKLTSLQFSCYSLTNAEISAIKCMYSN